MKNRIFGATIAVSACGILVSGAHGAATSPEEIVVTATPLGDILQPSEVLSGEQLLLKSAPTIGELSTSLVRVQPAHHVTKSTPRRTCPAFHSETLANIEH